MGKFELFNDRVGMYQFRLVAANGQVIVYSEQYHTKSAAMNGIESVKKNAASAKIVDLAK